MKLHRGGVLRRAPERTNILSVRFSDMEVAALNRLIDKTGTCASDIIRYAVVHHVHRELNEDAA